MSTLRVLQNPWFLAVVGGLLLALCFPGADFGPLAFVALVPLLWAIRDARPGPAYGRGLAGGFVFFAVLYSWIAALAQSKVGAIGGVAGYVLALVMALAIAVFACATAPILRSARIPGALKLLAVPSLWVLCEYVRQLGSLGMGWGDLGYTQWRDPLLLRVAPLTGIWGLSWLVVLVNTAIALGNGRLVGASVAAVLVFSAVGPLAARDAHPSGPTYQAASLQADINQDVPWDRNRPADPGYYQATLAAFARMTREAHDRGALLCVLAETAAPGYPRTDYQLRVSMARIAAENGVTLVAGGRDADPQTGLDRNVAILFTPVDPLHQELQMYSKQQLVPFGEFVPYQDRLQWLNALHVASFNDEPGSDDQPPLDAGSAVGKIGVGICYESSYARFLREQTRRGANVLTVITDDTWFGRTAAARQHEAMAAVRAAESSRYLVRCASTGISAIFGPDGTLLTEVGLFHRAVITAPIEPRAGETLFVRFGDWFVAACVLMALAPIMSYRARAGRDASACGEEDQAPEDAESAPNPAAA